LNLLGLGQAQNVEQAIAVATRSSIPAQNFVAVDSQGNLGWTIAGPILNKDFEASSFPQKSGQTNTQKLTRLDANNYPTIINPENNYIWNANARVASGLDYTKIGDDGLALGARAKQIEDNLNQVSIASENDLFKIQLDNKAVFLSRWRKILLTNVKAEDPLIKRALTQIENWSGFADKDDIGYWLVKRFRINVANALLNPIYQSFQQEISEEPASYHRYTPQYEYLLWEIIQAQPKELLPEENQTWSGFYTAQLMKELKPLINSEKKLEDLRWGRHNTARIKHPLSSAVPALSFWLDMPADELSGDRDMPLVQGRSFGASQRMVVSPGFEENAIMQMPGGQSGHPLSPFYRSGHQDWVNGLASPLMMQSVKHKLVLKAQLD
ncbi:MAG: penicillin acylase family protein, partial [Kangiellaceae bacterium]|nr:penicillin acylase family protein [Kangiellaceae bacterium]